MSCKNRQAGVNAVLTVGLVLFGKANAQFNEGTFPGVGSSINAPAQWSVSQNAVQGYGLSWGNHGSSYNLNTWASGLNCPDWPNNPVNCFTFHVGNAVQASVDGVSAFDPTYSDRANMVVQSSTNVTYWYVNENWGQGTGNGSAAQATPQYCDHNRLNTRGWMSDFWTTPYNLNGFTIKTTCKTACNPGQPNLDDVGGVAVAVAQHMITNNHWAARFAVVRLSDGVAYARCRVTVSWGDETDTSPCPDFIPTSGCSLDTTKDGSF